MHKTTHRPIVFIAGIALLIAVLAGCSFGTEGTGTLRMSLTDAPIADASAVEGVFITISGIEYNLNDTWIEDTGFEGPMTFNLLELTGGAIAPLSNTIIKAGYVSQIRFKLDAQHEGAARSINPLNYIVIDPDGEADGFVDEELDVKHELFVPSGSQTGYKAIGGFTIPRNGVVEITADFDVRKSVVKRGTGDDYLLKPTIRLVVNNQAGTITGSFGAGGTPAFDTYVIFAYEHDTYTDGEAPTGVEDETFIPFEHAVSSVAAESAGGTYVLPFLAAGSYDLIITGVDTDGSYVVIDSTTYAAIEVEPGTITNHDIQL
jgi:hypothetical protein